MKVSILRIGQLTIISLCLGLSGCSDGEYHDIELGGAPQATYASDVTATSFTANWFSVDGARYYLLDVSSDLDFYMMLDGYSAKEVSGSSAVVTGLDPSKHYFYRVRAANSVDETISSNIVPVRELDKAKLYNKLWKVHLEWSQLPSTDFPDMYFYDWGYAKAFIDGVEVYVGASRWGYVVGDGGGPENYMFVYQMNTNKYGFQFVHIEEDYFAAYVSVYDEDSIPFHNLVFFSN
jgi:hypothetical protein